MAQVIDTKTEHRAARVHLLPNVIAELKKQRKQNPVTTWVFEGPHVFPLDLATLGSKIIKKTLQGTGVEWHGFTHSVVVSVRGCTTTGRQSKPLPRYSVTARVPKWRWNTTLRYEGPFLHRPDDDDSSAITFWNTDMNDLQDLFASALKAIEERQLRNPKV
jgi:hypothetical protein